MKECTFERSSHDSEHPYAMIVKSMLRDKEISPKAKGILSYLLTLPNDWIVYHNYICQELNIGKDYLNSGLKELEKSGYMQRSRIKKKGVYQPYKYRFSESKKFLPNREIRTGENEKNTPEKMPSEYVVNQSGKTAAENPHLRKNDRMKNTNINVKRDCGNVHNSPVDEKNEEESYEHPPQSDQSFSSSNDSSIVQGKHVQGIGDLESFVLRDGSNLSQRTIRTWLKYSKDKLERLIANVAYYERQYDQGKKIFNHEAYIQNCFKFDYAKLEDICMQNELYAKFIKEENGIKINIFKTVVHIAIPGKEKEILYLNLDPSIFSYMLDNITKRI